MTQILIGARVFATKAAADAYCRDVRDRYIETHQVTSSEDQAFLTDLVSVHPEAAQKIGPGIDSFEVCENAKARAGGGSYAKTFGFWIIRTDRTATDFSWIRALTPPTHAQRVRSALRAAIEPQIRAARTAAFSRRPVRCPLTDVELEENTCHVDHRDPPFVDLAERFIDSVGGYQKVELVAGDADIGPRLADADLQGKWEAFHRDHATLVVVSNRANLSLLRRGQRR